MEWRNIRKPSHVLTINVMRWSKACVQTFFGRQNNTHQKKLAFGKQHVPEMRECNFEVKLFNFYETGAVVNSTTSVSA